MRKVVPLVLVMLAAGLWSGCDSASDDDPTDSELFVGTWNVVRVEDAQGDQTAVFQQAGDLSITFDEENYTLTFDSADGQNDIELPGPYTVNEATSRLTLTVTNPLGDPPTLPVVLVYDFDSDEEMELTVDQVTWLLLEAALASAGVDLQGDVTLTLEKS